MEFCRFWLSIKKHFRIFSCEWAFYNAKSSKTFFTITLFEPSHSSNYTINLPNLVSLNILGDNLDNTTIIKYLEACKYIFCPLTFYLAAHRAASMQCPPPQKSIFKCLFYTQCLTAKFSLFSKELFKELYVSLKIIFKEVEKRGKLKLIL